MISHANRAAALVDICNRCDLCFKRRVRPASLHARAMFARRHVASREATNMSFREACWFFRFPYGRQADGSECRLVEGGVALFKESRMLKLIRQAMSATSAPDCTPAPGSSPAAAPTQSTSTGKLSGPLKALSTLKKSAAQRTPKTPASNEIRETQTKWPGIVIKTRPSDSKAFVQQTKAGLDKIASEPVGARLLDAISSHEGNSPFGYKVAITPQQSEKTASMFRRTRVYQDGNKTTASSDQRASTPDVGASSSSVKWNPVQSQTPDSKRPAYIGLAHELIHANNNLRGRSLHAAAGMTSANAKAHDEHLVVGLGQYANAEFTENKIRAEHGLPPRMQYTGVDTPQPVAQNPAAPANAPQAGAATAAHPDRSSATRNSQTAADHTDPHSLEKEFGWLAPAVHDGQV